MLIALFLYIVVGDITKPKELVVTYDKYLMYKWNIVNCNNDSSLIITRNNVTYLNIPVQPANHGQTITVPWCAIQYSPTDSYEWYISYNECNKTSTESRTWTETIPVCYANDELNTCEINGNDKFYAVIEIPHYKKSLDLSCLHVYIRFKWWIKEPKVNIYTIDNNDVCTPFSMSDAYYSANFRTLSGGTHSSNITIGCTYESQIGPNDIAFGRRYILEYDKRGNIYEPIEGRINVQISTYIDDTYHRITVILRNVLIGVLCSPILVIAGMFIKKRYFPDQQYNELDNVLDNELDNEIHDENVQGDDQPDNNM